LTFRPLLEAFIRRSWYSVFPVVDTTGRCRVKEVVVCEAPFVAALVTVGSCPHHGLLSFNRPCTVMRTATKWATHTIAFLTWRFPVVSRTRRTEYQLIPSFR